MTVEEVGEDMCPVFICYAHDSKCFLAIAVEAEGAVKSSVQFVKDQIDNAGCSGTSIFFEVRSKGVGSWFEASRSDIPPGRDGFA